MSGHNIYLSNKLADFRVTAAVTIGLIFANAFNNDPLIVRGNDSLAKKAALALPSALPAPDISGNRLADIGLEIGTSAISIEAARRTSTLKELGTVAVGAQLSACAVNALVENGSWLNQTEKSQEDIGFSAISVAWFTKFLLDRSASSENNRSKNLWRASAALFAGAMTVGAYFVENNNGGKLDMLSHGAGITVGVLGYLFGHWRKAHKSEVLATS